MKNYFYLGIGIIITLIVGLLGYGVYMNQRGENEIAQRMENLRLPLTGTEVREREITPMAELELANLYCDDMIGVEYFAVVNAESRECHTFSSARVGQIERNGVFTVARDQRICRFDIDGLVCRIVNISDTV